MKIERLWYIDMNGRFEGRTFEGVMVQWCNFLTLTPDQSGNFLTVYKNEQFLYHCSPISLAELSNKSTRVARS